MPTQAPTDFEQSAHDHAGGSVVGELWQFLRYNKKYWLLPILAVLGMFGLLVLLAGTGAAPFIYTLF